MSPPYLHLPFPAVASPRVVRGNLAKDRRMPTKVVDHKVIKAKGDSTVLTDLEEAVVVLVDLVEMQAMADHSRAKTTEASTINASNRTGSEEGDAWTRIIHFPYVFACSCFSFSRLLKNSSFHLFSFRVRYITVHTHRNSINLYVYQMRFAPAEPSIA